jgi:hypothetical protein
MTEGKGAGIMIGKKEGEVMEEGEEFKDLKLGNKKPRLCRSTGR